MSISNQIVCPSRLMPLVLPQLPLHVPTQGCEAELQNADLP